MRALLRRWFRPTTGRHGERIARRHLRRVGHRILATNLELPGGEIDLLTLDKQRNTVVIVEVKTTANPSMDPPPEMHVDWKKQRQLVRLASTACRLMKLNDKPVRFDVIGVTLHPSGKHEVRHHEGAFESGM